DPEAHAALRLAPDARARVHVERHDRAPIRRVSRGLVLRAGERRHRRERGEMNDARTRALRRGDWRVGFGPAISDELAPAVARADEEQTRPRRDQPNRADVDRRRRDAITERAPERIVPHRSGEPNGDAFAREGERDHDRGASWLERERTRG